MAKLDYYDEVKNKLGGDFMFGDVGESMVEIADDLKKQKEVLMDQREVQEGIIKALNTEVRTLQTQKEALEKDLAAQKFHYRPYDLHQKPDRAFIEVNKADEPEGERLRAELEAWLDKNEIVSIYLDTDRHIVEVQSAKLPPRIKDVLSKFGSIYVVDKRNGTGPLDWIGTVLEALHEAK